MSDTHTIIGTYLGKLHNKLIDEMKMGFKVLIDMTHQKGIIILWFEVIIDRGYINIPLSHSFLFFGRGGGGGGALKLKEGGGRPANTSNEQYLVLEISPEQPPNPLLNS